jgi:hypothetical protein
MLYFLNTVVDGSKCGLMADLMWCLPFLQAILQLMLHVNMYDWCEETSRKNFYGARGTKSHYKHWFEIKFVFLLKHRGFVIQ